MTTTVQTDRVRNEKILPDDLSLYIGKKTLVKLILGAMDDLDARSPGSERPWTGNTTFPSAMMLTLLTYCYATGVYCSGDILLGIQHDQMIRYLCAGDYPDICVIRSFRRNHRERVAQCLTAALRRVWELRFCGEDAEPITGVSFVESSLTRWIDVKSTPDFKLEAEGRITQAVRADSMAMDM